MDNSMPIQQKQKKLLPPRGLKVSTKQPVNKIPESIPTVSESEHRMLTLYLEEWKAVLNTQAHFNELIIKLRATALTAFVTISATAIMIHKFGNLTAWEYRLLLIVPSILWILTCIMDIFYYNRLLLGAVKQAEKFDCATKFKNYGMFGMTSCINSYVSRRAYWICLVVYYILPLVLIWYIAIRTNLIPFWLIKLLGQT